MTDEAAARLLNRAKRHDSEQQRLLNLASAELDGRIHVVWLLRKGGVSMDRIARVLGHSRQLLNKQLSEFDEVTGRRKKAADAEAGPAEMPEAVSA